MLSGAAIASASEWKIIEQKDKLTDEVSHVTRNSYGVAGGYIDVTAKCNFLRANDTDKGDGKNDFINFTFDSYRHFGIARPYEGGAAANVQFRLDSGKIMSSGESEELAIITLINAVNNKLYSNEANLIFSGDLLRQLVFAKELRVRLPYEGDANADIEIKPSDLNALFMICPPAKKFLDGTYDLEIKKKKEKQARDASRSYPVQLENVIDDGDWQYVRSSIAAATSLNMEHEPFSWNNPENSHYGTVVMSKENGCRYFTITRLEADPNDNKVARTEMCSDNVLD
jgi:hypothetical protein